MDANGSAGSVHGSVDEHAFELHLQVTGHGQGFFGDVPLQIKVRFRFRLVLLFGTRLEKMGGRKETSRTTHLSSKLLNPLDSIVLVLHIRLRVLERDRIAGGVIAGFELAVPVGAAFGRDSPFGCIEDDFCDGFLQLLAGDVPVAAAQEVVVLLAAELEAVVAEIRGHADHELVHGVGGEVEG